MIIIPALVYLRYSPHTAVFLQKFGWRDDLDKQGNKTEKSSEKTLH